MLWKIYIVFLAAWLAERGIAQTAPPVKKELQSKADSNIFISSLNGVYGLGDSSGWYANSPKGDSIFHLGDSHFGVRVGGNRYSVINKNFKELYRNLKSLVEFGRHVVLVDSIGTKVFSTSDNSETEFFDSVRIHDNYALIFKNSKQGLINREANLEKRIAPAYDFVGPYYHGVLVMNGGKLGWIGPVEIPTEFDHIYKITPDVMAAKNKSGTVYYSLRVFNKLMIEPSDSIVFYNQFYKRVRGDLETVFHLTTNEQIGEIRNCQLHPYSFDRTPEKINYCIATKDSLCALFKNGKLLTGFNYNNILPAYQIPLPFFRVVNNHKVGVINDSGHWQLKPLYTDVVDKKNDHYIVRNGLFLGLRIKGDSVILPSAYKALAFSDHCYAIVSTDGTLFGLYDFINGREMTPRRYQSFECDSSFILARKGRHYDVYYKEELKFTDLVDAQFNGATVKGYKDGKIFMGYARNGSWEEYSYEIPSYKVITEEADPYPLRPFVFTLEADVYDYSVGKWGYYNFRSQQWRNPPLAHGGYEGNGTWLLDFEKDTLLRWQGIDFLSDKAVSPLETAWDKESRFRWIDVEKYGYNGGFSHTFNYLTVSPVCYETPGKGRCMENFKSKAVNAFFGNSLSSVLVENGHIEVAREGEISLSDYICQLSQNGNVHPAALSDYKKIIDPGAYIKIKGASEHILRSSGGNLKTIPAIASYEWINKQRHGPYIFRIGYQYGLLSDSGTYLLKPEFEIIEPFYAGKTLLFKTGIRSKRYRVYDPQTKKLSGLLAPMIEAKGELILLQLHNGKKAVLDIHLDTVFEKEQKIYLLGGKDFCIKESPKIIVQRNTSVLFNHVADSIEKINEDHFLVHTYNLNMIVNSSGDTVFKSHNAIKFVSLGENYILEDGRDNTYFSKDNTLLYKLGRERYTATLQQHLIVKEEGHVVLFKKNALTKISIRGEFHKAAGNYLVLKDKKYKQVYSYDGKPILKKAKQVKIINGDYLAYQDGKNFFLLNVLTSEKIKIKSMNVDLTKEGIEWEDVQENVQLLPLETSSGSLTIVEKNGRYALVSGKETLLPHNYFQIVPLAGSYLVQDHCEYMLYHARRRSFISNEAFESVTPYRSGIMTAKLGNISYLDLEGKLLSPILKDKIFLNR